MQVNLAGQLAIVAGGDSALDRALVQALEANGAKVEALRTADLPDAKEAGKRLNQAVRRCGVLHLLVDASALAEQPESWTGAALVERADALIRAAGEAMASQGNGRIVTLLSALGLLPARQESLASAMHAAVAATIRARALQLAPSGVIVNGLAVGAIGSDRANLVSHVPLARSGRVEEVATAALFLADPENTYTVGHILNADGGWQAGFARDF